MKAPVGGREPSRTMWTQADYTDEMQVLSLGVPQACIAIAGIPQRWLPCRRTHAPYGVPLVRSAGRDGRANGFSATHAGTPRG